MTVSVGVNVTLTFVVPAFGAIAGVVYAKPPATVPPDAFVTVPPLNVEAARVWPYVIAEGVGAVATTGVCLPTLTVTFAVVVL